MKLKSRGKKLARLEIAMSRESSPMAAATDPGRPLGCPKPWAGGDARRGAVPRMVLWACTSPHTHAHGCSMSQGHIFTPGGRRRALVHSLSCLVLPIPLQELPAFCASPANSTH